MIGNVGLAVPPTVYVIRHVLGSGAATRVVNVALSRVVLEIYGNGVRANVQSRTSRQHILGFVPKQWAREYKSNLSLSQILDVNVWYT